MLVCQGYFQCSEVLTLNVLHQRHLHHILVVHGTDIGRNALQAHLLAGSPAALTGNDDIGAVAHVTQGDGRNDSQLANTVGQFLQGVIVKFPSGLFRIGLNQLHIHLANVGRTFRLHLSGINQRIKSAPQCRVLLSYCHGRIVRLKKYDDDSYLFGLFLLTTSFARARWAFAPMESASYRMAGSP